MKIQGINSNPGQVAAPSFARNVRETLSLALYFCVTRFIEFYSLDADQTGKAGLMGIRRRGLLDDTFSSQYSSGFLVVCCA